MKLQFTVHRTNDSTVNKTVSLNGEDLSASVAAFEVELVSLVSGCGTYTHRFIGKEIEEAKQLFIQGQEVELEI